VLFFFCSVLGSNTWHWWGGEAAPPVPDVFAQNIFFFCRLFFAQPGEK
jgi:hypothetical protein